LKSLNSARGSRLLFQPWNIRNFSSELALPAFTVCRASSPFESSRLVIPCPPLSSIYPDPSATLSRISIHSSMLRRRSTYPLPPILFLQYASTQPKLLEYVRSLQFSSVCPFLRNLSTICPLPPPVCLQCAYSPLFRPTVWFLPPLVSLQCVLSPIVPLQCVLSLRFFLFSMSDPTTSFSSVCPFLRSFLFRSFLFSMSDPSSPFSSVCPTPPLVCLQYVRTLQFFLLCSSSFPIFSMSFPAQLLLFCISLASDRLSSFVLPFIMSFPIPWYAFRYVHPPSCSSQQSVLPSYASQYLCSMTASPVCPPPLNISGMSFPALGTMQYVLPLPELQQYVHPPLGFLHYALLR
jgi:hypothetical protein